VHKGNNVKEDGEKVTVHMLGRAYERLWVSSIRGICMEIVSFILKQKILDLQMILRG